MFQNDTYFSSFGEHSGRAILGVCFVKYVQETTNIRTCTSKGDILLSFNVEHISQWLTRFVHSKLASPV